MKIFLLLVMALAMHFPSFNQITDLAFVSSNHDTDLSSSTVYENNLNKINPFENNTHTSHSNLDNPITLSVDSDLNYLADREQYFKYAMETYLKEDWRNASIAFHTYISESPWILPERTEVFYYTAKLALNQGDYSKSIRLYEKFFNFSCEPSLYQAAEYDYALCHLADRKVKALELFNKIVANEQHQFYEEARCIIGVIQ